MTAPRTNASHDQNFVPTLIGVSTTDGSTPVPVEVDPTTGALIVSAGVGDLPSALVANQQTVTNSAVALPSGALTQGVILEALSTNAVSIFVGGAGVTISTGLELQAGASTSVMVSNTNLIYVICASSSPIITWIGS